ncbi:MBL fold metallo-hydrolase [Candidatus Woesearchaeota archaeon]|nr:MBL fold metallo-hydrolase [Candidatus Woesearchaeota archaeon]
MIEIIPVGGYSEIGRNCTIVKWKDEAVMLDLGLMMENYVPIQEENEKMPLDLLIREQAVPDLDAVREELKYIKGIIISHAHLDHIGAIPHFINKIKAPIYGTKFTIEIIKAILDDKKTKTGTKLITKKTNSQFKVSKNLKIQFIHVTHSTPQSVIIAVHTPEGTVVYANDFKFDEDPVLGEKTNFQALSKLKNVKALIIDSLYSQSQGKATSEAEAKKQLEIVMQENNHKNKNLVITTFSSQIARLKTITEITKKIGRTPVFVGRSMNKYITAAKKANLTDLTKKAEIIKYGSAIEKYFKQNKITTDKVFIVTGHQGEPRSVLSRMSKGKFFPFNDQDTIIFSCKIIPTEECFQNREKLEIELKARNLEIIKDIHASGHAYQEDHQQLIKTIKPENIIPTHGDLEMLQAQKQNCKKLGYKDENIHILQNFSKIYLK